jgi:hypothetical protein
MLYLKGYVVTTSIEEAEKQLPCAEKMVFDTQQEASAAGLAAEWQYGGGLKAYCCRYCHLWHLSSASSGD